MSSDALDTLSSTNPARLARLMTEQPAGAAWEPHELSQILRHQIGLAIPGSSITFADLLAHPRPEVELLQKVRVFAKSAMARSNGDLPPEVAAVLYYASILMARLHGGTRISQLDDGSLLRGIEWAVSQPWIDAEMRGLFSNGLATLSAK